MVAKDFIVAAAPNVIFISTHFTVLKILQHSIGDYASSLDSSHWSEIIRPAAPPLGRVRHYDDLTSQSSTFTSFFSNPHKLTTHATSQGCHNQQLALPRVAVHHSSTFTINKLTTTNKTTILYNYDMNSTFNEKTIPLPLTATPCQKYRHRINLFIWFEVPVTTYELLFYL